jgi:dsRNA-specific ribonuclease
METVNISEFSKLSNDEVIELKSKKEIHIIKHHYKEHLKDNYNDEDGVTSVDSAFIDDNKSVKTKRQLLTEPDLSSGLNETLIFDPFNSNNREITKEYIEKILVSYGVPGKVHNINLYKRAFVHKSYLKRPDIINKQNNVVIIEKPKSCMSLKTKSNERLEFLGDGVLECVTKYYLYRRFPKADEGFMTKKKIAIVKNEHIGKLAYDMGLNKFYIISKGAEEKKYRTNHGKLGCLFEAFIGALFLDFNKVQVKDEEKWFDSMFVTGPGLQVAQTFIENVFERHVNWGEIIMNDHDFKIILQMKLQKEFKTTPNYMIIQHDEDGYRMGVYLAINIPVQDILPENAEKITGNIKYKQIHDIIRSKGNILLLISESKHKIKKKAEQQACKYAIERLVE